MSFTTGCFDRRYFLRVGSLSLFGSLSLGDVLSLQAASPSSARTNDISVILFWLQGGISQLESFDLKPDADVRYRSLYKSIPTNVPGFHVSEKLPELAKRADKYATIRSMTHPFADHNAACVMMLSGHKQLSTIAFPVAGSVVAKELGPKSDLPPFIRVPGPIMSLESPGYLGREYAAFSAGDPNSENYQVRDLTLPMGVDWDRMGRRRGLLSLADNTFRRLESANQFETMDSYHQTAYSMMSSPVTKKAFDIQAEPDSLKEKYGRTSMGQGALLARRLVENGARFVTISQETQVWDMHWDIVPRSDQHMPPLDRAVAALLDDLEDRGMLENTLVLVTGEFGRTVEISSVVGRDHWPNVFSLIIAGAGITGGRVYGSSDEIGKFVKDNPVQVHDFMAAIYHKLGIDYTHEYMSNIGRPMKVLPDGSQPLEFLLS
jgi:uncharacterized protein (DUF1501 family)